MVLAAVAKVRVVKLLNSKTTLSLFHLFLKFNF